MISSPELAPNGHILLVEDDHHISAQLSEALQSRGYRTTARHDGNSGLHTAMEESFELILLDVMLPRMNGFSLLKQLRNRKSPPVISLNKDNEDKHSRKVRNVPELLRRIESMLHAKTTDEDLQQDEQCAFEQLQLERAHKQASLNGYKLDLTPMEFDLLWIFLQQHREVLSKEELYKKLMKREYRQHDRSLDMHISNLRKKLDLAGFNASQRLKTVRGKGYQLL